MFELYGVPSEKQAWIERSQKLLAALKEQIQRNSEENPDEMMLGLDDVFRAQADKIEKELQSVEDIAIIAHRAQVAATLMSQPDEAKVPTEPPQVDPATKLQNKRVDDLISMFTAYPRDAQNRILDIVSTFGQLSSVGQKHAVGRIKELAELPRYQAKKSEVEE